MNGKTGGKGVFFFGIFSNFSAVLRVRGKSWALCPGGKLFQPPFMGCHSFCKRRCSNNGCLSHGVDRGVGPTLPKAKAKAKAKGKAKAKAMAKTMNEMQETGGEVLTVLKTLVEKVGNVSKLVNPQKKGDSFSALVFPLANLKRVERA